MIEEAKQSRIQLEISQRIVEKLADGESFISLKTALLVL
jgi:hypothetical protein